MCLVVGGGIVGLATARAVVRTHPGRSVVVVEKEASVAAHQSGRNSGVIHAGVYYAPGSDKARLCVAGRASMVEFCREHGIEHAVCGKVVVAGDDDRSGATDRAGTTLRANGVRTEMIGPERLREIEPHVAGVARAARARHRDRRLRGRLSRARRRDRGGRRRRSASTARSCPGSETASGLVVETTDGPIEARRVVTCAGSARRRGGAGRQRTRRRRRPAGHRLPRRVPGAAAVAFAPRAHARLPGARPAVPVPRRASHPRGRRHGSRRSERGARVGSRGLPVAPRRPSTPPRHVRVLRASAGSPRRTGVSAWARWSVR